MCSNVSRDMSITNSYVYYIIVYIYSFDFIVVCDFVVLIISMSLNRDKKISLSKKVKENWKAGKIIYEHSFYLILRMIFLI